MPEKTTKVARRDSRYLWNFFEESKGVGKDLCSKCEGREGRNGTERRKCGRGNDRNRQAKGGGTGGWLIISKGSELGNNDLLSPNSQFKFRVKWSRFICLPPPPPAL